MKQDTDRIAKHGIPGLDYYKDVYEKWPCNDAQASWFIKIKCIDCKKCKSQYDFNNPAFLGCIINILELEHDENIDSFQNDEGILLDREIVDYLKDLLIEKKKIDEFNAKFVKNWKINCPAGYGNCLLKSLHQNQDLPRIFASTLVFTRIFGYIAILNRMLDFLSHNKGCAKCLQIYPQELEKLISILESRQVVELYLKKNQGVSSISDLESVNVFNEIFFAKHENKENDRDIKPGKSIQKSSYYLDKSKIIEITITQLDSRIEKLYDVQYHFPFTDDFFRFLIKEMEMELEKDQSFLKLQNFESILINVLNLSKKKLLDTIQLENDEEANTIVTLVTFSLLGFEKLIPLLLDENIEEIFLDSPGGFIYVHHVQFQHCKTPFILKETEIQMIISRLRFETNKNLNDLFPSLKCVLKNACFYARFNADVKPLNPNGFSLDIRRINRKIFNLFELFLMKTMNIDIMVFLIFCIQTRMNLTITGRTDSGKTTLLNALDMLYPEHLRKIYVEDEIETVTQDQNTFHQLKFQASNNQTKSDLIKNLLHRSPDVLILGEILTREETEALFHCISTGMKGIQTIHANNTRSLITRFLIHFGIDITCLQDLDFILTLQKLETGQRKIVEVTELSMDENSNSFTVHVLTSYNPKADEWHPIDYTSSKRIQEFLKKSKFDCNSFDEYLNEIKDLISNHLNNKDFSNTNLQRDLNQVYMDHRNYF